MEDSCYVIFEVGKKNKVIFFFLNKFRFKIHSISSIQFPIVKGFADIIFVLVKYIINAKGKKNNL